MRLTRYYARKPIDISHVRALRDLLKSEFGWNLSYASYTLCYVDAMYSVESIGVADKIVNDHGQPAHVHLAFTSQGGRTFGIETRLGNHISMDVDNKSDPPEKLLTAAESALGIERWADANRFQNPSSAFIAHVFDDEGHVAANELARFLSLLGLRCQSGRAFAPSSVSEKVNSRLIEHDLFFGIVTPQDDQTWITQEITTASVLRKPVFILKHADAELTAGILGDHEYIPFARGALSKTFIAILEGINEIAGRATKLYPWQDNSVQDALWRHA